MSDQLAGTIGEKIFGKHEKKAKLSREDADNINN
jgi:hypothetical protein